MPVNSLQIFRAGQVLLLAPALSHTRFVSHLPAVFVTLHPSLRQHTQLKEASLQVNETENVFGAGPQPTVAQFCRSVQDLIEHLPPPFTEGALVGLRVGKGVGRRVGRGVGSLLGREVGAGFDGLVTGW